MNFLKWIIQLIWPKPVEPPPPVLPKPIPPQITPRERLYSVAKSCVGQDVSPRDLAPDDFGCVESFEEVYMKAFGTYLNDTKKIPLLSTIPAQKLLSTSPMFRNTLDLLPGNIIISVTGAGNGVIPNGHVGIIGEGGKIYSNNSLTGKWDTQLTIQKWVNYYRVKGGMRVYVYERI